MRPFTRVLIVLLAPVLLLGAKAWGMQSSFSPFGGGSKPPEKPSPAAPIHRYKPAPQVAEAAAASTYAAARHHGAPLLHTQARHLVGRFAYGVTPALAAQVRRKGGARSWFEWQLSPQHVADHDTSQIVTWFPGLAWSPAKIWQQTIGGGMPALDACHEVGDCRLDDVLQVQAAVDVE